jgi:hypothetical protein
MTYQRTQIQFVCDCCGKESTKAKSEYERNIKLGRKNFCSRTCSAKYNNTHRTKPLVSNNDISQYSNNRRDEFTPFRYSLRCAKRRYKGCTLTLKDLKNQWELQNGICPYTKLKLILPEDGNIDTLDVTIRALLDRIDSSKPYEVENIQFISTPINYMKNSMSDEQTKEYLRVISANIINS